MTKVLYLVIAICFFTSTAHGQDVQLRIPVHFQTKSNGPGIAGWAVLPNALADENNIASLLVAGIAWKSKGNWLEVMGGTHRSQSGYVDPLINVRFQKNISSSLGLSGELQQTFRTQKRRTLWWLVLDTPVPHSKIRVGVEIENVNFWNGRRSYGLGPRISMPVPVTLPFGGKLTVATTHQFKTGKDFTRLYAVMNFKY